MSRSNTCEVCDDELPNPFEDGAHLRIETVDVAVRIRQPDRPHNNEVVKKTDVCDRECADEYRRENRHRMTRHYTIEVDY